jgi:glycosyltransferase involved in cell wall biosynthesis
MEDVKNYLGLIEAFLLLLKEMPAAHERLRLLIVGAGSNRQRCIERVREAGVEGLAWFPGERNDIPELMRSMDLFVLPSLGEGISNTILEAMSTGLPIVATRVGGNAELVEEGVTGMLVPSGSAGALAGAMQEYYRNPELLVEHGRAARKQVEARFSMEAMMSGYLEVYDKVLRRA